jgi:hypothetical protein
MSLSDKFQKIFEESAEAVRLKRKEENDAIERANNLTKQIYRELKEELERQAQYLGRNAMVLRFEEVALLGDSKWQAGKIKILDNGGKSEIAELKVECGEIIINSQKLGKIGEKFGESKQALVRLAELLGHYSVTRVPSVYRR